jgi:hypothetical protein
VLVLTGEKTTAYVVPLARHRRVLSVVSGREEFQRWPSRYRVWIRRTIHHGLNVLPVDAITLLNGGDQATNFDLQADDEIYIARRLLD